MVLTGENRSTQRKDQCHLYTTNLTRTDLKSNPGLRDDRPTIDRLSYIKNLSLTGIIFKAPVRTAQ
jgi:hypothetical protein